MYEWMTVLVCMSLEYLNVCECVHSFFSEGFVHNKHSLIKNQ